jgi:hypothetical protein
MSTDPLTMMVNTEGPSGNQSWDDEDEYWACNADGELDSSEDSSEECKCPTKHAWQAGTHNSNLIQVVSG